MQPKTPPPDRPRERARSMVGLAARQTRDVASEHRELERKLVILAAVRVILITLCLVAVFVLDLFEIAPLRPISAWKYMVMAGAYGLSIAVLALARRTSLRQVLAYGQIVLDLGIISLVVLFTGGIQSIFTFAYVFTVLEGSGTLQRKGAVVAAIGSSVTLGTIVSLQLDEWVAPALPTGRALFSYFMVVAGTGLIAHLSSTLAEKLRTTGRKLEESESDLERLEQLHEAIVRSLPAGLLTIDTQGVVRFANEAAMAILGLDLPALVGRALEEIVPAIAQRKAVRQTTASPPSPHDRFEDDFTRDDGTTIRIGYSFAPLGLPSERRMGMIVVFQDLTEINRLEQAVARSEKLATIGKLAAGLAHEVRNPLASMCASIDVLERSFAPPPGLERLMQNVVKEGDRLNALITDFLNFARPREPKFERRDLAAVVGSVLDVFRNDTLVRSAIEIEQRLEAGLVVAVDEDMIRQVMWNLLKNAAEAMAKDGGVLSVEVADTDAGPSIVIRDTGPGIAREELPRIFDPFYSTKTGGSGLGLAISHSILAAHGAKVWVESADGIGTAFTMRFPRVDVLRPSAISV